MTKRIEIGGIAMWINAKIYNLDTVSASVQNWWELENTKIYYDFFKKHKDLFEDD